MDAADCPIAEARVRSVKALGLAYNVQQNLYVEAPQLEQIVGAAAATTCGSCGKCPWSEADDG